MGGMTKRSDSREDRKVEQAAAQHHHHMKRQGNFEKQRFEKISKDKSFCKQSTMPTVNRKRKRDQFEGKICFLNV